MPSEFRFLIICMGAMQRLADGHVTLSGVLNDISVTAGGERAELAVIIGAILRPPMKGKRLDLMAWMLDSKGQREKLPGYAGTPLILPEKTGPDILPYSITIPMPRSGIYGFELFDRDGAFGPKEGLLATYMFGVHVS